MDLKNATALVTGGSSGIGLAIARSLIDAGSRVAITGRDQARLANAAKGIGAHAIAADVSREDDVMRTYREFFAKFGHLDILVNSAGFGVRRPLVQMDRAKFDAIFQTNVTGTMHVVSAAAAAMEGRGVVSYRVRGLWAGIDIDPALGTGREVCEALARRRVLAKDTHGSTIRFAPPIVISEEQLHHGLDQLEWVLHDLTA